MTTEEASKKVCPFKFNSNTLDVDGIFPEGTCLCESNRCMAWKWDIEEGGLESKTSGHCGLITNKEA